MDQPTGRFLQIEAIFDEALAAPPDAQAELIERRCHGDRELASEVRSLLDACAAEEQESAHHRTGRIPEPDAHPPGKRFGPYELDRLLGRGGMGAVYLAHRADGQFEQTVAVKLIDLPLATELFRERFRLERQILAELQHPYIARLLDGGSTTAGDLYLVMEYVEGVPIQSFCERDGLAVRRRIELFLRACEAVQFAHQHFIVHRDLKPDNILVAADGTPRLLDFGTAKLLSPAHGGPAGKLTREGYQSFTPQYASPEQVLGNPITTASDTYSLGVLLYLLLTGMPPYELKELTTAEMLRVICQEPPRRPTHAVGSDKRLDPDLDAILMKALRKEPQERYLTAEQMAADLRSYLGGLPVAARRGTLRYRAGKFIRRHGWGMAAAVLLAATLVAGITGIVWQSRAANVERRKAEARSEDLRQLSKSLLSELDDAIKQLPGSTGAQKLLVTRVLEHLDRMAKDAQGDRQTQLDLADAYSELGEIQGDPYVQNLGDSAGALSSLDKAIALVGPLTCGGFTDREALRALALAQEYRSAVLFGVGRTPEALLSMQSSTRTWDRLVAGRAVSPMLICDAGSAYGMLGDELGQSGTASLADTAAAVAAYRQALDLDYRALRIDPNTLRARRGLSIYQMKIGSVEMETDPAEALKDFQAALQRADALPKTEQGNLPAVRLHAMLIRKQAIALEKLGAYAQAAPLFQQAIEIHQAIADQDSKDLRALYDVVTVLDDEARCYEDAANPMLAANPVERSQNLRLAEKILSLSAAGLEKLLKHDPANEGWRALLGSTQVRIGTIATILRTPGATDELATQGLAALQQVAEKEHASALVLDQAADAFLTVEPPSLRNSQFALLCAQREVAISHARTPSRLLTLAQAYRASGQIKEGRATAAEGLALLPGPPPTSVKSNIRKLLEHEAQAPF